MATYKFGLEQTSMMQYDTNDHNKYSFALFVNNDWSWNKYFQNQIICVTEMMNQVGANCY